ncbi:MAG: serine O-acetyltransferase [Chloroflexi bacterium]|nr:serine O-acetyltransferase [Chloroflexota bacterium]
MKEDVRTVFEKDPAARSVLEVVLLYPGLHALWSHRVSHFLWRHRLRFLARFLSELSRLFTGIEIHPGASIGRRFFIDHGMGVVIGETAEIGDDVLMYQGVVLGGTALEKRKRHPTVGDHVVIGAAAVLLGPITIGDHARIGANSVVIKPVPAGVTIVGVPGRAVEADREGGAALEHGKLPDPLGMALNVIIAEQAALEERIRKLEQTAGIIAFQASEARLHEKLAIVQHVFSDGGGI